MGEWIDGPDGKLIPLLEQAYGSTEPRLEQLRARAERRNDVTSTLRVERDRLVEELLAAQESLKYAKMAEERARAEADQAKASALLAENTWRLVELDNAAAQDAAAAAIEEARADFEGGPYWYRRFNTSLAVGHGAGFVAIGSKVFGVVEDGSNVAVALLPLTLFSIGLVFAGSIPAALAIRQKIIAGWFSVVSGLVFILAIVSTLVAVYVQANFRLPEPTTSDFDAADVSAPLRKQPTFHEALPSSQNQLPAPALS